MTEITTIIATITGLTKAIGGLIGKIRDQSLRTDLQQIIIDLQNHVMEMQTTCMTLQDENRQLKGQLDKRADVAKLRKAMDKDRNAYWLDGEAYCIGCFDNKNKMISLVECSAYAHDGECPVCKNIYSEVFGDTPPGDPVGII